MFLLDALSSFGHLPFLYLTLLLGANAASVPSSRPIVHLDYASYRGAWDTNLKMGSYLGIRYTASPSGISNPFNI